MTVARVAGLTAHAALLAYSVCMSQAPLPSTGRYTAQRASTSQFIPLRGLRYPDYEVIVVNDGCAACATTPAAGVMRRW